tara:strand:+ start:357 stop:674 length:318 start_codon:yes stop_codon:yes gene_type:complete
MSNTIIKDPVLEPFHLSKDQYCYTVVETITPEEKNLGRFGNKGNANEGKDYEKSLGHYSTLAHALKSIAKSKLDKKSEYNSIIEYINTWKEEKEQMNELLNKIGL